MQKKKIAFFWTAAFNNLLSMTHYLKSLPPTTLEEQHKLGENFGDVTHFSMGDPFVLFCMVQNPWWFDWVVMLDQMSSKWEPVNIGHSEPGAD